MVWFPGARNDVVNVACPVESRVTVDKVVVPSRNWIVPVGTAPFVATRAVKVTACPAPEGFKDEVSVVVLDARLTVCVRVPEVLASQFELPE
jgi:hypothetical protein